MKLALGVTALLAVLALTLFLWRTQPPQRSLAHESLVPQSHAESGVVLLEILDAGESSRESQVVVRAAPAAALETPSARASIVRARIVSELGAPIVGARLQALRITPEASGTSTVSGDVTLELPRELHESGESVLLTFEVTSDGHATDRRTAAVEPAGTLLLGDWTLIAAGTVAGVVRDPSGRGVGGAEVACLDATITTADWSGRRHFTLERLWRPGTRTRSAPDGSYVLELVPRGRPRVFAVAKDWLAGATEPLDLAAGLHLTGVDIRLGARVSGREIGGVVLRPDKTPAAFATVRVHSAGGTQVMRADAHGRFVARSLKDERHDVTALDADRRLREATALGVPSGTSDLVLELSHAPEVSLRVLSTKGEPIDTFGVEFESTDGELSLFSVPIAPHASGTIAFPLPAREFIVLVDAPGWMPTKLGPLAPARVSNPLEIQLSPAVGVSGVVVASGEPVRGASVALHAAVTTYTEYNGFPVHRRPQASASATTGEDGAFLLPVTAPGAYFLSADATGWARAEIGPIDLDSTVTREQAIELTRGGSIEVQVRSSTQRSVAGHVIALSRGDGQTRTARSDEEGRSTFSQLTPGRFEVTFVDAEIDHRYGTTREGTTSAEEVPWNCEVVDGRATKFELWVEDRGHRPCILDGELAIDGRSAEGWNARLQHDGDQRTASAFVSSDGTFRLSMARPGNYRLQLTPAGADVAGMLVILDQVRLEIGEARWSLALETGGLEGRVASASAAPPGLTFFLSMQGSSSCFVPVVANAQGAFRCPLVPVGKGRVVRVDPNVPLEKQVPAELAVVEIERGLTATVQLP
ncbi:MAG: hypothetical protein ACKVWV_06930 [Planctomycetota bacterium]